jgi:hypothetical protein
VGTRRRMAKRGGTRDAHAAAIAQRAVVTAHLPVERLSEWRKAVALVIESAAGAVAVSDAATAVIDGRVKASEMAELQMRVGGVLDALGRLRDDEGEGLLPTVSADGLKFSIDSSISPPVVVVDGPFQSLFWFQLTALLREIGLHRVERCEICGAPYIRSREFRRACSLKCQAEVRRVSDRKRSARRRLLKRDEVLDAKHRHYVRRIRKRLPNAKVTRRRQSSVR